MARVLGRGSWARLFVSHAALALVPVLLLGLVLAANYRSEVRQRGLAVGKSEAQLVAHTAVEPILDGRLLSAGLSSPENADLHRLVGHAVGRQEILRLRLRDLTGQVVFSDDGSGFGDKPEDEALDAAAGQTVGRLTKLNSDPDDTGPVGPESVEVYLPLMAGPGNERVGVLEVYLPYAPIQADMTAGLDVLYRDMAFGLAALYVALFLIAMSVSRGLRRQVKLNKFHAEHDALTGLANRSLFNQQGESALGRAGRDGSETVVALIDLDRFKEVNDTTLAQIRESIGAEVMVSGLPLSVDASVGYVVAPADGTEMADLLQRADVAMYLAKADHSGVCRYDPARDHYDARKLNLIAQLRHGIDAGQLLLHYQPKASLPGGTTKAVEALVRWEHPSHGLLYPDSFLPLAEQTDLIDKLTAWVLATALSEIAALGNVGQEELAVAVNVSARNLIRSNFADQVIDILRTSDVSPNRLIVEITETALLVDPARAATVLGQLAGAGVTVSIDDFGIGQTSLGYLSSLPVGELKIDKSFVTDMLTSPTHRAIVRSVVELGHNLSLRVVAEGVEGSEVLEALSSIGCDLAQGFHIAKPMPIDQLTIWMSPPLDQPPESDTPATVAGRSRKPIPDGCSRGSASYPNVKSQAWTPGVAVNSRSPVVSLVAGKSV